MSIISSFLSADQWYKECHWRDYRSNQKQSSWINCFYSTNLFPRNHQSTSWAFCFANWVFFPTVWQNIHWFSWCLDVQQSSTNIQRLWIFASEWSLASLSSCLRWHCDGTFCIRIACLLEQLYILCGFSNGYMIPCVYCSTSEKDDEMRFQRNCFSGIVSISCTRNSSDEYHHFNVRTNKTHRLLFFHYILNHCGSKFKMQFFVDTYCA